MNYHHYEQEDYYYQSAGKQMIQAVQCSPQKRSIKASEETYGGPSSLHSPIIMHKTKKVQLQSMSAQKQRQNRVMGHQIMQHNSGLKKSPLMLACSNFRLSAQKTCEKNQAVRMSSLGMSSGAKGDDNEGMDSFRAYG